MIFVLRIERHESGEYYVDLPSLTSEFPSIQEDINVDMYVVELKDKNDKLVKKFKPFMRLRIKANKHEPRLCLPTDFASTYKIKDDYKLSFAVDFPDSRRRRTNIAHKIWEFWWSRYKLHSFP